MGQLSPITPLLRGHAVPYDPLPRIFLVGDMLRGQLSPITPLLRGHAVPYDPLPRIFLVGDICPP